jgi:predicted dehydrogenase
MKKESFTETDPDISNLRKIGIGILGYGFMGKTHTNAFKKIAYMSSSWPPPAIPELITICGRNEDKVKEAALKFGYKNYFTDWKEAVKDPRIDIFDNCSPDDTHHEPSIAALKEGKHVICEKPLAMNVQNAKEMYLAAKEAGVKNMCAHNYRFMPAVRLAKEILEKNYLGDIYEFKCRYLQPYGADPDEPIENIWYATGTKSGVMLGIGSHVIDMARFLIGEITSVFGLQKVFNIERSTKKGGLETSEADESNSAIVEFEDGSVGTLEASCINVGRKNQLVWEIYGTKGSMLWDLEDLNNLHVNIARNDLYELSGFTKINVTDSDHPFADMIWPPGHIMGWETGHVNELMHFVDAVVDDKKIEPYGATFYDGYVTQLIMSAIRQSSKTGRKILIEPDV